MTAHLLAAALLTAVSLASSAQSRPAADAPGIDHVILGINNLQRGIAEFERVTGVRPVFGGVYKNLGTHYALVSLGSGRFLEIRAPNPAEGAWSPDVDMLNTLTGLRPYGWSIATREIQALQKRLEAGGFETAPIRAESRPLPDGSRFLWVTLSIRDTERRYPVFTQWAEGSLHPSRTSPAGCTLVSVGVEDPYLASLRKVLAAARFDMPLTQSDVSRTTIILQCPKGKVTFR